VGKLPNTLITEAPKKIDGNWSYKDLNHFLALPADFIPDMKMEFWEIEEPQLGADIIAYLRTLSNKPISFP
jgi:cytochrome c